LLRHRSGGTSRRFSDLAQLESDPSGRVALSIFRALARQGINFRRGVWHHPLLALTASDFLVADRLGPGENCEALDIADWRVAIRP
jgi:ureidoglycolate hydrolase